jgi:hypothetical protein
MINDRFHAFQKKAASLLGIALAMALLPSCGDDSGLGKRYPVSGAVTYKGEPLESGQISFVPATPGETTREATGTIENGSYTLTTATDGDGALPGEYKVRIVAKAIDDTTIKKTIAQKGGGARQQDVGKAFAKGKNLVPAKYQLTETSGLTAKVEEKSNTVDFDLKD